VITENRRSRISIEDPRSEDDRAQVAATCAVRLKLQMPMVVDGVDNAVASAYGGWPDRLYLVGTDGRIAYQGGEGPFGFQPDELAAAIDRELGARC
jgi:Iodothyronine deiodinase